MALSVANGADRPSFTQQGSVDWVQLVNTTVSIPLAVLARLAAAGVDPVTVIVAQNISSTFNLSTAGYRRLDEALDQLKSFSSIGNWIWFGFGIKHIVRDLAQTKQGLASLMLCGCLSELHSPDVSASIMLELANIFSPPEQLQPSPQQWKNFVESCSGILRTTNFGCVAQQFMTFQQQTVTCSFAGNYKEVAAALHAVTRVSTGDLKSITLSGSQSCGWIAAIGYWFLGLDVEILTSEGHELYSSSSRKEDIRISVVYGESNTSEVQIRDTTYSIRKIDEFIAGYDNQYKFRMTAPSRWETCIREVFGSSGRRLLEAQNEFGVLLGIAARVFEGLSKAEPGGPFEHFDFQTWFGYNMGQYGKGFISSASSWFPELSHMRDQMEFGMSLPFAEAASRYEQAALAIAELCPCGDCAERTFTGYCLPVLAETIIFLIWNLSSLCLHGDFKPNQAGLQLIYDLNNGTAETYYDFGERYSFGKRYWGSITNLVRLLDLASVYHTAQFLFTPCLDPQSEITAFSATSVWGTCFFFDVLQEVSDKPEKVTLLHVVPGTIETKHGRRYTHVSDNTTGPPNGYLGFRWRQDRSHAWAPDAKLEYDADPFKALVSLEDEANVDTGSKDITVGLIVQESLQALQVDLVFSSARGTCQFGPYFLLRSIAESSGLVYCGHRNCAILQPPYDTKIRLYESDIMRKIVTVDTEGKMALLNRVKGEKAVIIRRLHNNVLARCIGLLDVCKRRENVILRGKACISCCITTASVHKYSSFYIVS